jgi:hypothetical protein
LLIILVNNPSVCFAPHKVNPYLMFSKGNELKALNLEALSAGDAAVNDICTYEGPITAMHYAYLVNWNDNGKSVNEFVIAVQIGSTTSSLLLMDMWLLYMLFQRYR